MKRKFYELDSDEEEILKAFEEGKLVRVKNFVKEKKEAIEAAKNTLSKTKNINIRLSEKDLNKLKAKAAREGIPYQTLAASILHRFTDE
jgi:predicted DNA binding CopG/RHH family protein